MLGRSWGDSAAAAAGRAAGERMSCVLDADGESFLSCSVRYRLDVCAVSMRRMDAPYVYVCASPRRVAPPNLAKARAAAVHARGPGHCHAAAAAALALSTALHCSVPVSRGRPAPVQHSSMHTYMHAEGGGRGPARACPAAPVCVPGCRRPPLSPTERPLPTAFARGAGQPVNTTASARTQWAGGCLPKPCRPWQQPPRPPGCSPSSRRPRRARSARSGGSARSRRRQRPPP